MGSHFNFSNFGNMGDGAGTKPPVVSSPLVHQSSVYSLTFDEFQNTWGGSLGKDFGSMNMDELLKNICTAEETHAVTGTPGVVETSGGNLQRQGSLTLPRTLSQKTVDEVWKDFIRETSSTAKDVAAATRPPDPPQRQRTLGEMTLEEFLLKAGVVREDTNKQIGRSDSVGFFSDLAQLNNDNSGLALGFQPQVPNHENNNGSFVMNQASNLGMNVSGNRPSQQLHQSRNQQQPMQQNQQQQPPLFPKPATVAFASPMHMANGAQLASPGARSSAVGMAGNPGINNGLARRGAGLGTANVKVATASPGNRISPPDGVSRSDADTSSVSPIPYVFSRGRKPNAALEKVVERRHRRMIKNRESAARSRARKQAYTLELEAEIAKLKEMNEELERKQDEIMQMQKNQFLEKMNHPWGGKRLCLRRTLTGPW
ncbi:ABSCISIC ACID-INSENSITIVE 5-like protein 6 [Linum perenne]